MAVWWWSQPLHSFAIFLLLLHLPPDHPAVDADGHPAVDADGHPVVDADGHPPCIMVGMLDMKHFSSTSHLYKTENLS